MVSMHWSPVCCLRHLMDLSLRKKMYLMWYSARNTAAFPDASLVYMWCTVDPMAPSAQAGMDVYQSALRMVRI